MANLQTNTEDFSNAQYTDDGAGLLVTVNVAAAPIAFGANAGRADQVEDTSAAAISIMNCGFLSKTAGDTSTYFFSVFVLKDTNTTRFPEFQGRFVGGVTATPSFNINTQTGATSAPGSFGAGASPDSFGVDDFDALYWRVWWSYHDTNNNTDYTARILPAVSATLGGAAANATVGSITAIGLNITNTGTLQTYEPDPTYSYLAFTTPFVGRIGTRRIR